MSRTQNQAFGLTVLTMAFAIGHISGCHLNPAVSFNLWAGGRFPANDLIPYIISQVLGAIAAGGVLYLIASGKAGFELSAGFASNGYGSHSPSGFSLPAALISEVVMTMMFLLVILGAADQRAPQGLAPIAIGLCLTLIHLISISFIGGQLKAKVAGTRMACPNETARAVSQQMANLFTSGAEVVETSFMGANVLLLKNSSALR